MYLNRNFWSVNFQPYFYKICKSETFVILDDVGNDGIGPFDQDYPGPDADGSEANGVPDPGEPNFGRQDNDDLMPPHFSVQ